MDLSHHDYLQILQYYNINYVKLNKIKIKEAAENILASKLCRCIKKVGSDDEQRSIGICKKSVLGRKHLKNYNFTCKKKAKFIPKKKGSKNLVKTKRVLQINKKKR